MLEVPVYNTSGKQTDTLKVDENAFGGEVNVSLLKQAITAYHAHRHPSTAATKSRGMVEGSTRKLFRQKGTGNARRGMIRTPVMRGGGHTFGKCGYKRPRKFPRSMRRAALNSAILAKMLGEDLFVLEGLSVESPKTGAMAAILRNLKVERSCLLATAGLDKTVYLSCRNIPGVSVMPCAELNAFDVAMRQKMIVTSEAMQRLLSGVGEGEEVQA